VTHSQNAAAQAHVLTPKAAPQQARDVSRNGAGDVAKTAGPSLDPRESGKQVGPTDARAAELLAASAKHAANSLTPHDAIAEPLACNVPVIAITSGKGGVGKSSIAVNIASCLAQMRIRTTLIDADPGLANADLLCGISPTTRLDSVLAAGGARRSMSTIAVQTPAGFSLVPGSAGLARMADLGPAERVALLSAMSELETSNDVLMVDTGAGLSESVLAFVKHADFAIVIATPEPTSIADAYAMIKLLHAAKKPEPAGVRAAAGALPKRGGVFLVINQAATQAEAMQVYQRITLTTQRFLGTAPELLGWIVHDDAMRAAVRARTPITAYQPQAHASLQLHKLAAEIAMRAGVGEVQSHASQRTGGIRGFFAKVLGK
jgi:flagellar biosynthesis protein FlhG